MRWEEGGHRVCILDPNNPCINSKASTTFQQTNPVVHQLQHCCNVEPCPRRLIGSLTVLRCLVMLSPSVDAPIAESRKRTELDSLSAWEVARVAMMPAPSCPARLFPSAFPRLLMQAIWACGETEAPRLIRLATPRTPVSNHLTVHPITIRRFVMFECRPSRSSAVHFHQQALQARRALDKNAVFSQDVPMY